MATLILLALGAAAVWAAGLYLFPFRHCRKCGGTGRTQRPGSRLIHRAALTARTELARQRADRADRKAAERAAAPVPPRTGYRPRS
jgi:hypothetical protein